MGRVFAAIAAALGAAIIAPITTGTPAHAGYTWCGSGVNSWGDGRVAWGSCEGVTSPTRWRLVVTCTWGQSRTSSWFYGSGRTDVSCPAWTVVTGHWTEAIG
ncbi:hypothetical protein [Verrucosispora sp. NA02020]|uniref:hypothetical protein n=1 Tax=Verrucosispora sp. NA02020 TaxID=2742132 RepID=UPI00159065A1|nr:hypothetical protein [Verrucosispora sp. NA02020]QKW12243.1 hypothetical protein HUT12_05160 [Verrucosispora sp. NA02020]